MLRVTRTPIVPTALLRAMRDPAAGAVVTFLGTTRNENAGRRVVRLEYEAFSRMAEREMRALAATATKRWTLRKVAMVHRSVAIAVSAGHRAEAFAACRWLIDRLKEIVPIWKREHFRGGQVWIGPQQGIPETSAGRTASRGTSARGGRRHAPRRGDR